MYGLFMLQLHATELTLALALFQVVGTMNIDAESLLLTTLAKSLVGLGYEVEVSCFAMLHRLLVWRRPLHDVSY
jgi:hypothetical protein